MKMEKTGKNKEKSKLRRGLEKALMVGTGVAFGLGFFANKAEAQSRFYQPLDTYDFYGSGDVNNDFKINRQDSIAMQDVINGTYVFEEGDYIGSKRADMNFDGVVNQTDLDSLVSHLNWETLLTPRSHYNQLKTPQERLERIDQIRSLANLQEICEGAPPEEDCDCNQRAYWAFLKIEGTKDTAIINGIKRFAPHDYDSTQFGTFKIPTNVVILTDFDVQSGHAMNNFSIGNDLIELDEGVNYDVELDLLGIEPGEGNFRAIDSFYEMVGTPKGMGESIFSNYYRYEFKDLVPNLVWTWGSLDEIVGSKRDTIHPVIDTNLEEKVYNGSPWIQISLRDENFRRGYLTLDNGGTEIPLSEENAFNPNLPAGVHNAAIYVQDEAGLEALKRIRFETLSPNSIEEKQIPKLHIYPNPTKNIVTLESKKGIDTYVRTFDLSGKLINEIFDNDQDGKTEMDISRLPPSIYPVMVTNPQGEIIGTGKIVKQ